MARPSTLTEIEAAVWQQLDAAVNDKAHEWRTPVLASVNGDAADARVIVLREVDARQKQLLFYTDERAGKVAQLLNHPRGMVVMWSRALGWQLRCHVRLALEMSLHEDSERRALEGELAELETAWRRAEEIAAIADDLLVPETVRSRVKG